MINLTKVEAGKTPLRTRAGYKVVKWWLQEDIPDTFFPIRAIIEMPDGTTAEMPFNRNGRRFINVASEFDLYAIPPRHKRRTSDEKLDVMPDVWRTIQCVKIGDLDGVTRANKWRKHITSRNEKLVYNYVIGRSDERMG